MKSCIRPCNNCSFLFRQKCIYFICSITFSWSPPLYILVTNFVLTMILSLLIKIFLWDWLFSHCCLLLYLRELQKSSFPIFNTSKSLLTFSTMFCMNCIGPSVSSSDSLLSFCKKKQSTQFCLNFLEKSNWQFFVIIFIRHFNFWEEIVNLFIFSCHFRWVFSSVSLISFLMLTIFTTVKVLRYENNELRIVYITSLHITLYLQHY